MQKLVLPELGEGIAEAVISGWHFRERDAVKEGDDIVELITDKAAFNIPSPASGVIKKIYYRQGDTVKTGDVLAELE